MSFKNILVAIDRLPSSVKVFEQALELAQKQSASLIIVHCLNDPTLGGISSLIDVGTGVGAYSTGIGRLQQLDQENLQSEIKQVEAWLQTYWQQATDQGVAAEFDYKVGDPGTQICDLARSWSADLIVLGRRGHTGLTEMLAGSVSNHVLHHALCPVLVIQREV
jgi:nucleotide-binding universal stress UspA family protein